LYVNTRLEEELSPLQQISVDFCLCLSDTRFGNGKDKTSKERERERESAAAVRHDNKKGRHL
jgi:hypothetical protein